MAESTAKKFYAAYLNFASRRPFNEVDKYRLQDAPDRRVKRLMEKENKRARDDARREYNEAVRSLAAFLKRRDPRFLRSDSNDPLRAKALEKQRQQSQLRDAAVQAAKKRQENAKAYQEQEWQRVRLEESSEEDDEYEDEDGSDLEDAGSAEGAADGDIASEEEEEQEDEEPAEDWFCPACEKDFNSQGAWDNHERSKKHLKNLEKLKKRMQDEEDEFGLSNEAEEKLSVVDDDATLPSDAADTEAGPQGKRKLTKKEKKRMQQLAENFGQPPSSELIAEEPEHLEERERPGKEQSQGLSEPEPDPHAPASAEDTASSDVKAEKEPAAPQISKKDKRRAREAAKKNASGTSTPGEVCNVCQMHFTSRTKLFSHINDTGHAAAVAVDESDLAERKAKGGKKKGGRR